MAGEPTLYHGNESVDGWVEYLQNMLLIKTQLGNHHYKSGTFDDFTLAAVKEFQEKKRLKVDGIVGDQTWAVLRGEPDAPAPHDDGRAPGTYVEQGIEMRFTNEIQYLQDDDRVRFWAASVGTVHPTTGTVHPVVHLKLPDGSSREVTATHEANEHNQFFQINDITGGVAGRYSMLIQLPMESGGDTQQFEFDRT